MTTGEVNSLVEQLRDIWLAESTYACRQEWLDNVGAVIGELCEATGNSTSTFPEVTQ